MSECVINDQSPTRLLFRRVGGSVHVVVPVSASTSVVSVCEHQLLLCSIMYFFAYTHVSSVMYVYNSTCVDWYVRGAVGV